MSMTKRMLRLQLTLLLTILLAAALWLSFGTDTAHAADVKVTVNGNQVQFDQPPVIENDRTLAPLRKVFEALDAEVEWNDVTKTVKAYWAGNSMTLMIGDNTIYLGDGSTVTLDVPAKIINGRTLVPLRAVSESMDALVNWDNATKTVVITSSEVKTVRVMTVDELMANIHSNTHIILEPGVYNLSEWLNKTYKSGEWLKMRNNGYSNIEIDDQVYDGLGLIIKNVDNLKITTAAHNGDVMSEIIAEPRYCDVMTFDGCTNVYLSGIVMGHTETGDCSGDVIKLTDSYNVIMRDMDLYGCGVYGLSTVSSANVQMFDSVIRDCSSGIMDINRSSYLRFDNCMFYNCGAWSPLSFVNSTATFNDCIFYDEFYGEYASFIYADPQCEVTFNNCQLDPSAVAVLESADGYGDWITYAFG